MRLRSSLPWIAAAIYGATVVLWLSGDRRSGRIFDEFSSFNTSPSGLSLAFRYLHETAAGRRRVERLTRTISADALPSGAVVFRVAPSFPPYLGMEELVRKDPEQVHGKRDPGPAEDGSDGTASETVKPADRRRMRSDARARKRGDDAGDASALRGRLLTAAEEEWIRGGGTLVLAVRAPYGPLAVEDTDKTALLRKVFPIWPSVRKVWIDAPRVLAGEALNHTHALLLLGVHPVASRCPIGAGKVLMMSCPEIFRNDRIAEGDHLALLAELASETPAVYFDEFVHAVRAESGLLPLLARWGLGPALALAALASLAFYWRERVSLGPAEDDGAETRSEAVDLVDSLAQLYDRAFRRADAVALYHRSFVRSVAILTGLRGESLDSRVTELIGAGSHAPADHATKDISAAEFDRSMSVINEAYRRLEHAKRR